MICATLSHNNNHNFHVLAYVINVTMSLGTYFFPQQVILREARSVSIYILAQSHSLIYITTSEGFLISQLFLQNTLLPNLDSKPHFQTM